LVRVVYLCLFDVSHTSISQKALPNNRQRFFFVVMFEVAVLFI